MVFQLIYTCALDANLGMDDLKNIATESRARNLERGITGILLCREGSVLQVLEGDEEVVKNLYNTIADDPRVTNPSY